MRRCKVFFLGCSPFFFVCFLHVSLASCQVVSIVSYPVRVRKYLLSFDVLRKAGGTGGEGGGGGAGGGGAAAHC